MCLNDRALDKVGEIKYVRSISFLAAGGKFQWVWSVQDETPSVKVVHDMV